jgi:hypothetical protein
MAFYEYYTNRFVIHLRGGLISLIYQQTVEARSVDLGEIDGVTLMGTDVERIVGSFGSIHELWGSLLDIAVAVYLLERQVGLACLIPGLTALCKFLFCSCALKKKVADQRRVQFS